MRIFGWAVSVSLLTVFLVPYVQAQDPIVFPAEGQSEEQMEKDKFFCYQWAKKETGFDPMEIPKATEAPPQRYRAHGSGGRQTDAPGCRRRPGGHSRRPWVDTEDRLFFFE